MRIGIGWIEMVILLIIGGFVVFVLAGAFRRRGSASGGSNQLHPNLKQCPGCGARIGENVDACPQCGLRISA